MYWSHCGEPVLFAPCKVGSTPGLSPADLNSSSTNKPTTIAAPIATMMIIVLRDSSGASRRFSFAAIVSGIVGTEKSFCNASHLRGGLELIRRLDAAGVPQYFIAPGVSRSTLPINQNQSVL